MTEEVDAIGLAFDRSSLADSPLFRPHVTRLPELVVPKGLPSAVRAQAIRAWTDRTRAEYIGVMIVRHFHGLLVDLNAPMDLQEVALVMTLQEQRHANLCMAAVQALGGEAEVAFTLEELQMQRSNAPIADQLLEQVAGTYAVGEVTALGLLTAAIRALPDTGFTGILRAIAADETLHAKIGPRMLKSMRDDGWFPWPGTDAVVAIAKRHVEAMSARDVVEDEEVAFFDAHPELAPWMAQVGIPNSRSFHAAYHRALNEDVPKYWLREGLPSPLA